MTINKDNILRFETGVVDAFLKKHDNTAAWYKHMTYTQLLKSIREIVGKLLRDLKQFTPTISSDDDGFVDYKKLVAILPLNGKLVSNQQFGTFFDNLRKSGDKQLGGKLGSDVFQVLPSESRGAQWDNSYFMIRAQSAVYTAVQGQSSVF